MNYLRRINIIETVLFESLKTARQLYSNKISTKEFEFLVSLDPSKTFKYIEKICSFYLQGLNFSEIKKYIDRFEELSLKNIITQKDINSFKYYSEFQKYIESFDSIITKTEERNLVKTKGTELVFENSEIIVLLVKDASAAIQYGKGTKWCISAIKNNSFNSYSADNTTYYFVFQKNLSSENPNYKIAVGVLTNGKLKVTNAVNKPISPSILTKIGLNNSIFSSIKLTPKEKLIQLIDGSYTINKDGSIDVVGDVFFQGVKIKSISEVAYFRKVSGDFECFGIGITSLKGSPEYVGGKFSISQNKLKSLDFCPKVVIGDFRCHKNQITSLEISPEYVGGNFNASFNNLYSLKDFNCEVDGNLDCTSNNISSSEVKPNSVAGDFII